MTSSGCHSDKVLSTKVCYSLATMITDLCRDLTYDSREARHILMIRGEHGIQCMPYSSRIIIEILSEIHTMEKCGFLKSMIHYQIL